MGGNLRDKTFFYEIVKSYGISGRDGSGNNFGARKVFSRSPVEGSGGRKFIGRGWRQVSDFVYTRTEIIRFESIKRTYPIFEGVKGEGLGFEHFAVTKLIKLLGINDGTGGRRTILFFDTETTGLSTGAGSLIFLFGALKVVEDSSSLLFEQVFLSDFPGEADFLTYIEEIIGNSDLLVSFNGKGFDTHLLGSRFILNGMDLTLPSQVDLLYIARRLWKRVIGSCTLRNIEEKILGYRRIGDVPGVEIPGIYFTYLKDGKYSLLERVFSHNRMDVISMVVLLFLMMNLLLSDLKNDRMQFTTETETDIPVDAVALGSLLLENGGESRAKKLLLRAFGKGDVMAGRLLSLYYKKRGNWDRARGIWEGMLERKNLFAAIELAKYYEHREGSYGKALSIVENVLSWGFPLDNTLRMEILHRRRRLLNRINKRRAGI